MPDPEDREVPLGQAKGAAQQQQAFMAQTRVQPGPQPEIILPPAEPEIPNIIPLADGEMNMDDLLFAGTERPDEPVTAGLPGFGVSPASVSQRLRALVDAGAGSEDVLRLLAEAERRNL